MKLSKQDRRQRLRFRIRKTVSGTVQRPRLAVFRSNKEIYAQLIDDVSGKTIVGTTAIQEYESIDLSYLKNGIYIIKFQTDTETICTKVIKQ